MVQHISADTNKQAYLGSFAAFADACAARAAAVDGKATKGTLEVVEGQLCVSHCGHNSCRRTHIPATEFAPDVFSTRRSFPSTPRRWRCWSMGSPLPPAPRLTRGAGAGACPAAASRTSRNTEGEHNEEAKCRRVIAEIKAHWAAHGGCKVCHTCDTDVLSGDHEGRLGKDDPRQCLDAAWWAMQWRRRGAARTLPRPQQHGEVQVPLLPQPREEPRHPHGRRPQRTWRRGRTPSSCRDYIIKKQAHANEEKKRRGKCEHPQCCDPRTGLPRVVEEENCHAFHFAHKDEVDKTFTIAEMVGNGQSPATAIPKMDKEMPKCNLYCANCHHKYDTLPRLKEGQELLDALLARGAPVCEECEA